MILLVESGRSVEIARDGCRLLMTVMEKPVSGISQCTGIAMRISEAVTLVAAITATIAEARQAAK